MKRTRVYQWCLAGLVLLSCIGQGWGQTPYTPETPEVIHRILLIYDASNSMNARWQNASKMELSKKLILDILDSLRDVKNLEVGLRVYGHQSQYPPLDCKDTRLEVGFEPNNVAKVMARIKTLKSKGSTPISYALEQAVNDFPPCDHCRNIVVLITDGIEECGGDPCASSQLLQKKGIILKPFIIGIGEDFEDSFRCVGEYFDASREEDFTKSFQVILSRVLNPTSVQVNLLDAYGEPRETNVNMSFYDHTSGQLLYNYVHTLNYMGYPDTLSLDPLRVYDMIVHTLPPKRMDSIVLRSGVHNQIGMKIPQGDLMIKMSGSREAMAKNIPCLVYESGKSEIVNVQYVNDKVRYLSGEYDLELLTLPRIRLEKVLVTSRELTQLDLPMPGILVFQRYTEGYASLYVQNGNIETLVHSFNENNKIETLYLQPGKYRIVNRSKFNMRTSATREKTFEIKAGVTTNIRL